MALGLFVGRGFRPELQGDYTIKRNVMQGAGIGIVVNGSGQVARNWLADGSRDGILLFGMTAPLRVAMNIVHRFAGHAIDIARGSTSSYIYHNDFRRNGGIDCVDRTNGEGTAGTANIWLRNLGAEDDPKGICTPAP